MKITGIIAEYNPFHYGHKYHIEKARELTDPDLLICVMSGNFNQRGDVSIVDKFQKTEAALRNGVDLVVELPYVSTVQNAYVFGSKAVEILNALHIDHLVFGSETNNLEELKKYAELNIDVTRLKELLREGNSFPKAYGLLAGSLYPNDILAVTYLKSLLNTDIIPISIQRTNDYHSENISAVSSATAIRKAALNGEDFSATTPTKIENPVFNKDLYPYLRRILMTHSSEELRKIHLVDEGIENMFKKNAVTYENYEDFIRASISRRYTRARIQRTSLQIINNITKKEVSSLPQAEYIRILGFNSKGREYLSSIKKEDIQIITQFKHIPEPFKDIEWRTSMIYSTLLKDSNQYLKKELKGPVIID